MIEQIFRQIAQKTQAILCVLTSIFGRYDGKYADQTCTIDWFNSPFISNDVSFYSTVTDFARFRGLSISHFLSFAEKKLKSCMGIISIDGINSSSEDGTV